MEKNKEVIVFYDGVCKFCDKTVQFLLRRNKKEIFRFATLQDAHELELFPASLLSVDSIVVFVDGVFFTKSRAVIKLASFLPFPYHLIAHFGWIPPGIGDGLYDLIARYRFQIFGKYKSCPLPEPHQVQFFISKQVLNLNRSKFYPAS